jgi:hypothetical protein
MPDVQRKLNILSNKCWRNVRTQDRLPDRLLLPKGGRTIKSISIFSSWLVGLARGGRIVRCLLVDQTDAVRGRGTITDRAADIVLDRENGLVLDTAMGWCWRDARIRCAGRKRVGRCLLKNEPFERLTVGSLTGGVNGRGVSASACRARVEILETTARADRAISPAHVA